MSTFTLTHQVNDDDREELLAGLGAYNRQFISRDNWGPLSVSHRDEQGMLRGGVIAARIRKLALYRLSLGGRNAPWQWSGQRTAGSRRAGGGKDGMSLCAGGYL